MKTNMEKLKAVLSGVSEDLTVVVLPDFFLDRLITLEKTQSEFTKTVAEIASRKGGSLDGIPQTDIRGGNAINVASALATLGVKVIPIICTSQLGRELLEHYLKPLGVDLSHVKVAGSASVTTALELAGQNGKVNVMLRDLGALAGFGPEDLSEADYEAIRMADFVCVFNWAGTRDHGTELARNIFDVVKAHGRGKTFFDSADPTPNCEKIPELVEKVLKTRQLDILSLNENEAITYARYLKGSEVSEIVDKRIDEIALESARFLARQLSARIDLHTTSFSATVTRQNEILVPAFKVNALRATGAGDAWDAGNIYGEANGLSDGSRLTLANALSALYLEDLEGKHPTRQQLINFLKTSSAQWPLSEYGNT